MAQTLRIALDARVPAGQWGGVQQVVQGLASGFARIDHRSELLFIAYKGSEAWLAPHLGPGASIVTVSPAFGKPAARRAFDVIRQRVPALAFQAAEIANGLRRTTPAPARSNGFLESLGVDLVHFLVPQAVLTDIPSIYQPHDLQHVHLPELFLPLQVRYRDATYRAFASQAAVVAVMTEWGRDDLARSFGIAHEKIAVIPWAPVAGLRSVRDDQLLAGARERRSRDVRRDLPERFVMYPAQTWRHKNHARLLDAIALLRDRGIRVDLVSTGRLNEGFPALERQVTRLRLEDQVTFLGYVDDAALQDLYRRATGLVFPSLFEGWGLPVVEAFAHGVPVAAANATVLPEVARGGALLFDPLNVTDIADAIERLWTDEELRADLRRRGAVRAADLDWTKTAATFQALYKRVARVPLEPSESALLAPPTLVA
jgi:glycosyltransferase involved in cell wall biosynthesis